MGRSTIVRGALIVITAGMPQLAHGNVLQESTTHSQHANNATEPHEHLSPYCYLDDDGHFAGGKVTTLQPEGLKGTPVTVAPWTTLHAVPSQAAGSSSALSGSAPPNRLDLVFVGDGYRNPQLDTYADHVDNLVSSLFTNEPYTTYASYFNVHRVDVVSNDSGVDNAPTQGVMKDTALDMTYWFGGIERALWVDTAKAWSFANNVPDADMVIAIAKNAMHGGLSLNGSDVMTVAGASSGAHLTVQHELGHGLGKLADEYFFNDGATHTGTLDFGEPNISILEHAEMANSDSKWAHWLGEDIPGAGGTVSTYEGARYHQFGIFRPTANSMMRTSGRPFNAPSREALILELYRRVNPIEATIDPNVFYDESTTLWVTPMQPIGHDLKIEWTIDGLPIPGATSESLSLCGVAMNTGWHAVGVTVTDTTEMVRDEALRAAWLTQSVFFVVNTKGSEGASSYCTAGANSVGTGATLEALGSTALAANDFGLQVQSGPAGQPGLFFTGRNSVESPFGDGFLCVAGAIVRFPVEAIQPDGTVHRPMDWQTLPGGLHVAAGETRNFQYWYRDPGGPGGTGFNLTDALRVLLCP